MSRGNNLIFNNLQRLETILSIPRKHGSAGEATLGRMLVNRFGFQEHQDDKGKALAYIRWVGKESKTLWSCHIDTAHYDFKGGVKQKIVVDYECGLVMSGGDYPLGADNGAGVWLLLEMIEAGIHGTYVFHRGEECGGIGSSGMSTYWPKLLETHTHAIAFDRRGNDDIITHQFRGRCCSDKFAQQMCELLKMDYAPCTMGSFTDTANYIEHIPECTNISVGYDFEHTKHETLDLLHLRALRNRVIEVFANPPELVVERKVTDVDDWGCEIGGWTSGRYANTYGYGNTLYSSERKKRKKDKEMVPDYMQPEDIIDMSWSELRRAVANDPEGYADLLSRFAEELNWYVLRDADEELRKDGRLEDDDEEEPLALTDEEMDERARLLAGVRSRRTD